MISLVDLYCHVMDYSHGCMPDTGARKVPALQREHYGEWGKPLTVTPEGVKEILRYWAILFEKKKKQNKKTSCRYHTTK